MRILLVEDEEEIRNFMRKAILIEDSGVEVSGVANGMEAVRSIAGSSPPQGIILDMLMPDMDGWEFLQILDAMENRLPVVILTAVQKNNAALAGIVTTYTNVLAVENKPLAIEDISRILLLFRKNLSGP